MKKLSIKDQIKARSFFVFFFIGGIGALVLTRVFSLQTSKLAKEVQKVEKTILKEKEIPATRGNIYAADGKSLLATSIPLYKVGLAPKQAREELFSQSVDSLSLLLSGFFKDRTTEEYKNLILRAHKQEKKYIPLGDRKVSHEEMAYIKTFPLFREGKYKGGGKFDREEFRYLPFNNMATRTIGKLDPENPSIGRFGLEYSFNKHLAGKNGRGVFEQLPGGYLIPVESALEVQATPGYDVITTIDINFQDIAEHALKEQVLATNAKYGTVLVMETATGELKAIANLTRRVRGDEIIYLEDASHAVLGMTDPGSTFKLATMLAVLEEGNLKPTDQAVNCTGQTRIHNATLTCSHEHGNLTVQEVFEQSCNIGTYALIKRVFGLSNFEAYREYLSTFRIDKAVDFQLKGEKVPLIKKADSKSYSATTFPWMSIGYEMAISPLQMLTFYNAVANDGYWVQPLLVKQIKDVEKTVTTFSANRLNSRFADKENIRYVQEMLRAVVEKGTAKGIKEGACTVAGKTGTAQKRINGTYQAGKYYTSFIGFFPAEQPKYTCLVVIDQPEGAQRYGGDVCAPVFRKIADRIFSYDISIHPTLKLADKPTKILKQPHKTLARDMAQITEKLNIDAEIPEENTLGSIQVGQEKTAWKKGDLGVAGLTLRDALHVLENKGYKVRHQGLGKVREVEKLGEKELLLVLN